MSEKIKSSENLNIREIPLEQKIATIISYFSSSEPEELSRYIEDFYNTFHTILPPYIMTYTALKYAEKKLRGSLEEIDEINIIQESKKEAFRLIVYELTELPLKSYEPSKSTDERDINNIYTIVAKRIKQ